MEDAVLSHAAVVGQTLGHYRLIEKIGAGGMGEVYRAQDEHLEREVALKVLRPGTVANEHSRKRFRKEALALSKLNHPNIATIHDFDTQQNMDFLVMEYIPGITLSEKLVGRALPEKEVVRLGMQLVEGLSAAHEQGVVHRDLKPDNLRLTTDGRLKILDFGLAKLRLPVAASDVTESLQVNEDFAGTLPYMAPEQLLGGEIDSRTDIWAVGCILYEMATGQRPFLGSGTRLMDAILRKTFSLPSELNLSRSSSLPTIISKCLEKESEHRYQSAKELTVDLYRLQPAVKGLQSEGGSKADSLQTSDRKKSLLQQFKTLNMSRRFLSLTFAFGLLVAVAFVVFLVVRMHVKSRPAEIEPPRIAVLPFETLGTASQEYIADGLTDEIAGLLSRVRNLQVIAPVSVQRFKTTTLPLTELSRELQARYFVTGSIEEENTKVRIRVRMLDASTGILWARNYDRSANNNLSVENEVAQDVVQSLALALGGEERQVLSKPVTQNPQAFDAYLHGKSLVRTFNNRGQEESFSSAEEALRRAIQLDRQMAAAYGELAHLYFLHDVERARSTKQERLRVAAEQALAIDPKQIAALDALAMMYAWMRQNDTAYRYALNVLALNPHDPGAFMVLGAVYGSNGMLNEALIAFRKAGEAEPLYLYPMTNAAEVLVMMGRTEEAWQENEEAAAIEPDNYGVLLDRAWIRYHQGRFDDAEQIARSAESHLAPAERAGAYLIQAWVYSRRGSHTKAQALLRQIELSPLVQSSFDLQLWLAEAWALENKPGKSLPLLTRVSKIQPNYPWFVRNANLQVLRGNPDFEELLTELKAEWETNSKRFQKVADVMSGNATLSTI
jgi:serine/threonine protein kinase/Flp pilus assembly protein TadD